MSKMKLARRLKHLDNSQLLTIYNHFSPRRVNKFIDRYSAEIRVASVLSREGLVPWDGRTTLCHMELEGGVYLYKIEDDPLMDQRRERAIRRVMMTDRIFLKVDRNPKKYGSLSYQRFDCYKDGMLVYEYVEKLGKKFGVDGKGKALADVKHDVSRGFIEVRQTNNDLEAM